MLWGLAYERGEPHPSGEAGTLVALIIDAADLRRVLGSQVISFDHQRASQYRVESVALRSGYEVAVGLRILTSPEEFD